MMKHSTLRSINYKMLAEMSNSVSSEKNIFWWNRREIEWLTIGQWQEEGEILFSHFIYHVEVKDGGTLLHHNLATSNFPFFLLS